MPDLKDRTHCPELPLECPEGFPKRFFDALERYAVQHVETGGFLRAVLENNLTVAVGVADQETVGELKQIVTFVYNRLPSNCWGTPDKVTAWLKERSH